MSIRVLFFASLADVVGNREIAVDASGFTDVKSIFDKFAGDYPALQTYRSSVLFALNSEFARPAAEVKDGDEVAFFPPVSGG
jgi:molybdopterin synthase sulfur carrier subunit